MILHLWTQAIFFLAIRPAAYNLSIILDISGSMLEWVGYRNRLDVAKDAINKLIETYTTMGDVRVQVTLFDGEASTQDRWMTAEEAQSFIYNVYSLNGSTNYDAALDLAIQGFGKPGKLEDAQNYSYFLTDCYPVFGQGGVNSLSPGWIDPGDADTGIQPSEERIWIDFLNENKIKSYAFAVIEVDSLDTIAPIAFDGHKNQNNDSELAFIVKDMDKLRSLFMETAYENRPHASSNLLTGANTEGVIAGYGADGGNVLSFSIDGSTYNYNHHTGLMTVEGTNNSTYDQNTKTVLINTQQGGYISLNFDSGDYVYYAKQNYNGGLYEEKIAFSVVDNDGDVVASEQVLKISKTAEAGALKESDVISRTDLDSMGDTILGLETMTSNQAAHNPQLKNQSLAVVDTNVDNGSSQAQDLALVYTDVDKDLLKIDYTI